MRIRLTRKEKAVFKLLLKVVAELAPDTVLRVAGGWVRDKLLGLTSNDIDVSTDNLSGEAFANLVKAHLDAQGVRCREVTLIKANPDQSKHLATAMLKMLGQPIDFVQLRSEHYAEHSRIPSEVRPGTAEEDASRRDLTINALFYNINEGRVEDFVGGIADLENRVARTPIDPFRTFMDDPLRVLRVVRFASKLDLALDPALVKAAEHPEVHRALRYKVSRERVWNELAWKPEPAGMKPGALAGQSPVRAARLLFDLGLMETLFDLKKEEMKDLGHPGDLAPFDMDQMTPHHDLDLFEHTLSVLKHAIDKCDDRGVEDPVERASTALAALLHDIGKRCTELHGTDKNGGRTFHGHEKMSGKMAARILKNLKAPSDFTARVSSIVGGHMRPFALLKGVKKSALRRFVRDFGDDWPKVVDLALADALAKGDEPKAKVGRQYAELEARISEAQASMGGGTSPRRPITGHDLAEIGIDKGPAMGRIFRALDEALLEDPGMSRDEALALACKICQST
jgi:tRNA nucleotidyltransferase/poly(A) polymerase